MRSARARRTFRLILGPACGAGALRHRGRLPVHLPCSRVRSPRDAGRNPGTRASSSQRPHIELLETSLTSCGSGSLLPRPRRTRTTDHRESVTVLHSDTLAKAARLASFALSGRRSPTRSGRAAPPAPDDERRVATLGQRFAMRGAFARHSPFSSSRMHVEHVQAAPASSQCESLRHRACGRAIARVPDDATAFPRARSSSGSRPRHLAGPDLDALRLLVQAAA